MSLQPISSIINAVLGFILIAILLILPIVLTILNIMNLFRKRKFKPNMIDGVIMTLGSIFTVLLFQIWSPKEYDVQLHVPSMDLEWHTPLAAAHLPTIIVFAIIGVLGYIVIRIHKTNLPPLLCVVCISCMIIGSIIGIIWIIQLSPHYFENGVAIPGEALYFCIFPINYIICCFDITKQVIRQYVDKESDKEYKNQILRKCNLLLRNSRDWPVFAIVLMLPVFAIVLVALMLFGQQPSAIIKAFTETSDWLLSQKISPPPLEVDAHYLCTVSLRGHREIVKPLRYGIRRNERIVVNRQLCIANAFEQLIQERLPKTHRFIRFIYDKYGYPSSKHITYPISADIVYIFMKPLEWLFLAVLYLFCRNPEDRIATQYLPAIKNSEK